MVRLQQENQAKVDRSILAAWSLMLSGCPDCVEPPRQTGDVDAQHFSLVATAVSMVFAQDRELATPMENAGRESFFMACRGAGRGGKADRSPKATNGYREMCE